MSTPLAAAALLVLLPVAFNVAFALLARAFDYPDVLRRPTDEILRRFDAGGAELRTLWWAFMLTALAMLPLAALVGVVLADAAPAIAVLSVVVGSTAALAQALGLARWPFIVPELARRWVAAGDRTAADGGPADGGPAAAERASIEAVFVALHRYLGVGVGEHLGYLLTGTWTLLIGVGFAVAGPVPAALALAGLPIGLALLVGALEFVGPNEPRGWSVAERLVPLAYVAWSVWLIALGVALAVRSPI
jgi:hypothetical protein